jgi:hypothetical protein
VVGLGEVMQFTAARLLVFIGRSGDAPEKPCRNTQVYLGWDKVIKIKVSKNDYQRSLFVSYLSFRRTSELTSIANQE